MQFTVPYIPNSTPPGHAPIPETIGSMHFLTRGGVLRCGAGSGPCPAEFTSDLGLALRRDGQKSVEQGHVQLLSP